MPSFTHLGLELCFPSSRRSRRRPLSRLYGYIYASRAVEEAADALFHVFTAGSMLLEQLEKPPMPSFTSLRLDLCFHNGRKSRRCPLSRL